MASTSLINALATVMAAQVDGTNTLPPGTPANASVSVIGQTLHFSFGLPQGQEGPAGQDGAQGPAFAQAVVDGVTTLNPWESASANVSFDGSNVRFTFAIPRGYDGSQGPPWSNGSDGNQGAQGNQGPPFAQAVVDGVSTLDPGQPASVQTSFDGSNVRFTFGIPRGQDGSNGSDGAQGPTGEVSEAMLSSTIGNALSSTSANTNGVGTLGLTANPDYDQSQLQQLANKVDELINALRR
jgi:hypothetical protein